MKKLMFTAAIAAMVFAGCNNRQNGEDNTDGMGAGDGTDTTEMYQDTSMAAPVDTTMDTTSMR